MKLLSTILLLLCALFMTGCGPTPAKNQLATIRARGTLLVGTIESPSTYFERDQVTQGFEYELVQVFAEWLGVNVEFVLAKTPQELEMLLNSERVDLIASSVAITPKRRAKYRFGPTYSHVEPKLIYRQGTSAIKELEQLSDEIFVASGSIGEELLKSLHPKYPNLRWRSQEQLDMEQIWTSVASGQLPYSIVLDSTLVQIQRYYPDLSEGPSLEMSYPVAWALTKRPDDSLYAAIIEFFGLQTDNGVIAQLDEKYFGHLRRFDFVNTKTFMERLETLLPRYRPLFQRHSGELDWRLLAALSYQESHWDPKARSFTGVRGLMMLTEDTAKDMNVRDRTDPEQSIRGGARYLQQLVDLVPESVPEDERFWFALTAYNLGQGHMLDARRLAEMVGKNPDSWSDLQTVLPLLQQKRWHSKLTYGYARGGEAKAFVTNVRQFYQSLVWYENQRGKGGSIPRQIPESVPASDSSVTSAH